MTANTSNTAPMSDRQKTLVWNVSLLFWLSFALIVAHVVDDTLIGEPSAWGLSLAAYWALNISWYLLLPTFGWMLARRGYISGFAIILLFALLALLGAGTDHLRHLTSDFRINSEVTDILGGLGIGNTDLYARSLLGALYWLLGLATSQPHTHTMFSTMLIVISSGVYIVLGAASLMSMRAFRGYKQAVAMAAAQYAKAGEHVCTCSMPPATHQAESQERALQKP
jgi:hypothetical protein